MISSEARLKHRSSTEPGMFLSFLAGSNISWLCRFLDETLSPGGPMSTATIDRDKLPFRLYAVACVTYPDWSEQIKECDRDGDRLARPAPYTRVVCRVQDPLVTEQAAVILFRGISFHPLRSGIIIPSGHTTLYFQLGQSRSD